MTGPHAVAREAAIARLTVIGPRAVERLAAVADSAAESEVRVAALRALEGIADRRGLKIAIKAAADDRDPAVAAAAVSLARLFIREARGAAVVEMLTTIAIDAGRSETVRIAAIRALTDLDQATIAPLLKTLAKDRNPAVRAEAEGRPVRPRSTGARPVATPDVDAILTAASDSGVPENPDQLRQALASAGRSVALAKILAIVESVRERESDEPPKRREAWAAVRAAAHLALARRRSRIGVYDLREWVATAQGRLPLDAFAALSLVGDESCLEPIAVRYAATSDDWSRTHLAGIFQAIVEREGLSRRNPTMKRIERKRKETLRELWPEPARRAAGKRPGAARLR